MQTQREADIKRADLLSNRVNELVKREDEREFGRVRNLEERSFTNEAETIKSLQAQIENLRQQINAAQLARNAAADIGKLGASHQQT